MAIKINHINHVLHFLKDDSLLGEPITQEKIDKIHCYSTYGEKVKIEELPKLIGYTVEMNVEGDHRNDGQMVDYTFTFTSPKGKETEIDTEMCLMVGFNLPSETLTLN